jgi:DNA-binding NarL/FixJ family response regulator
MQSRILGLRVLIVEKNPMFLDLILAAMQRDFGVSALGVRSGSEALSYCRAARPDVVVVERLIVGGNGFSFAYASRREFSTTRWIGMLPEDAADSASEAIENNLDGLVMQSASFETLMFAIAEASAGRKYYCQQSTAALAKKLVSTQWSNCTERERKILHYLGHGLNLKEIALRFETSLKTVQNQVTALKSKLQLVDLGGLATFARQNSLREPERFETLRTIQLKMAPVAKMFG